MSTTTYVLTLPMCDIHKYELGNPNIVARYDGKTINGPWANMCTACLVTHGVGLGTGKGQELIVGDAPERDRKAEVAAAIDAGDADAVWDAVGDGDLLDFI